MSVRYVGRSMSLTEKIDVRETLIDWGESAIRGEMVTWDETHPSREKKTTNKVAICPTCGTLVDKGKIG